LRTLEAQIEDPIRAREAAVRDEQATAETVLTKHSARRDGLRKDHAVASESVRANRDERARALKELEKLREVWRIAAPDTEWSEEKSCCVPRLGSERTGAARGYCVADGRGAGSLEYGGPGCAA
jgi:hypothetical protein